VLIRCLDHWHSMPHSQVSTCFLALPLLPPANHRCVIDVGAASLQATTDHRSTHLDFPACRCATNTGHVPASRETWGSCRVPLLLLPVCGKHQKSRFLGVRSRNYSGVKQQVVQAPSPDKHLLRHE